MARGSGDLVEAINALNQNMERLIEALQLDRLGGGRSGSAGNPLGSTAGASPSGGGASGLGGGSMAAGGPSGPGLAMQFLGLGGLTTAAGAVGAIASTVNTGLSAAAEATNPFRTEQLNTISAAREVASSVPFGGAAFSLLMNTTGAGRGAAIEDRIAASVGGFIRNQRESGVDPTVDQIRSFAKSRRTIEEDVDRMMASARDIIGQQSKDSLNENTKALNKLTDTLEQFKTKSVEGISGFIPGPGGTILRGVQMGQDAWKAFGPSPEGGK